MSIRFHSHNVKFGKKAMQAGIVLSGWAGSPAPKIAMTLGGLDHIFEYENDVRLVIHHLHDLLPKLAGVAAMEEEIRIRSAEFDRVQVERAAAANRAGLRPEFRSGDVVRVLQPTSDEIRLGTFTPYEATLNQTRPGSGVVNLRGQHGGAICLSWTDVEMVRPCERRAAITVAVGDRVRFAAENHDGPAYGSAGSEAVVVTLDGSNDVTLRLEGGFGGGRMVGATLDVLEMVESVADVLARCRANALPGTARVGDRVMIVSESPLGDYGHVGEAGEVLNLEPNGSLRIRLGRRSASRLGNDCVVGAARTVIVARRAPSHTDFPIGSQIRVTTAAGRTVRVGLEGVVQVHERINRRGRPTAASNGAVLGVLFTGRTRRNFLRPDQVELINVTASPGPFDLPAGTHVGRVDEGAVTPRSFQVGDRIRITRNVDNTDDGCFGRVGDIGVISGVGGTFRVDFFESDNEDLSHHSASPTAITRRCFNWGVSASEMELLSSAPAITPARPFQVGDRIRIGRANTPWSEVGDTGTVTALDGLGGRVRIDPEFNRRTDFNRDDSHNSLFRAVLIEASEASET